MKATVKTHGLGDVLKKLSKLTDEVKNKTLDDAVGKGAYILREEAKSNCYVAPAPYTVKFNGSYVTLQPGALRDSIIMVRIPHSELRGFDAMFKITTRQKDANNANIGKIANLLEYGGNIRGFPQSGHPFMRPAVQTHSQKAIQRTSKYLREEIERIWRRT